MLDMNTFTPKKGDKFYVNGYGKKGTVIEYGKKGTVIEYIDDYNWTIEWDHTKEIIKAPFTPQGVKWLFIDGVLVKPYLD